MIIPPVKDCWDCPFNHYLGEQFGDEHRCSADREDRHVTYTDYPPEWCPLRSGPIQITLSETAV